MITKKLTNFSIGLWSLVLVLGVSSCNQMETPDPVQELSEELAVATDDGRINARTAAHVVPILWTGGNGGNADCSDVCSYKYSTGRNNYENGAFSMGWPEGLTVMVSDDGKYVSWSYEAPAGYCLESIAVIVKGGSGANIYQYWSGTTEDSGLHSPYTGSKNKSIADLSNLTFCFDLIECH